MSFIYTQATGDEQLKTGHVRHNEESQYRKEAAPRTFAFEQKVDEDF